MVDLTMHPAILLSTEIRKNPWLTWQKPWELLSAEANFNGSFYTSFSTFSLCHLFFFQRVQSQESLRTFFHKDHENIFKKRLCVHNTQT